MLDATLPWTYTIDEAIHLQESLRQHLVLTWDGRQIDTIGGVDVSYTSSTVRAAITLYSYPELVFLHTVTAEAPQAFPYIAGLLIFRVGPAILAAWQKLPEQPDILLVHGQGIAHPRGIGLASHLGLWFDKPTIGVAKTRLYGIEKEPGSAQGDQSILLDEQDSTKIIGAVVRTRCSAKPVYVSPGHLIDLQHSVEFVLATCRGYRLPEPLRTAHERASRYDRSESAKVRGSV